MCAWSHFLSVSGDALRRNPEMLLCITISFQANCHSAWTWAWMQLFFCHSLVPWSRAPINTTGPAEPPDSSLYRLQFLNLLIRCDCGITPSAISSLHPRPHQSTWWSACNSDKAVLNGIRSPRPWRTGSVINHSAFWNTTVCWCRLEVQTCICVYRPLASKHSLLAADPTYGVLLWALFRKPVRLLKHISVMHASTGERRVRQEGPHCYPMFSGGELNVVNFWVFSSAVSPSGIWNNWRVHSEICFCASQLI